MFLINKTFLLHLIILNYVYYLLHVSQTTTVFLTDIKIYTYNLILKLEKLVLY
jgi:hypothetical protein